MTSERFFRRLGTLLWDMGRAESAAVTAFRLLEPSPWLTDHEKADIARFVHEEAEHGRVTKTWGQHLTPNSPPVAPFAALARRDVRSAQCLSEPARTIETFAATHWNERNTPRHYPGWITAFLRLGLDALARDFEQIVGEERGHVTWGERVLRRWEIEHPDLIPRFRLAICTAGRVYAAVIHATHRPIWDIARATSSAGSTKRPAC